MYDSCYGSVDSLEKFPGSGCILAHCMGLGKTLQVFTPTNNRVLQLINMFFFLFLISL